MADAEKGRRQVRDERTCVSDGATAPSDTGALRIFTSSSSIEFPHVATSEFPVCSSLHFCKSFRQ